MNNKIDITSTALEKGIDVAKSFVDKIISPSAEELGLLIKDRVSLWRFNNQIKILNKAKAQCEKNNISIKSISPKLLCPYLENASLEDDDNLQDKWANLLVNMVDSQQNIQNHVFPYILSQLSKDEFVFLEAILQQKKQRIIRLKEDLKIFIDTKDSKIKDMKQEVDRLSSEVDETIKSDGNHFSSKATELRSKQLSIENEIRMMRFQESKIKRKISAPQYILDGALKEFEVSNIIRLGLAKAEYETNVGRHSIDIPSPQPNEEYVTVDFDVDVETDETIILTELGELFIEACGEKNT